MDIEKLKIELLELAKGNAEICNLIEHTFLRLNEGSEQE